MLSDLISLILILIIAITLIASTISLRSNLKRSQKFTKPLGTFLSLAMTVLSVIAAWAIAIWQP